MVLQRPRSSSSISRQYHRLAHQERFSVTDAVQLKLKLQALDHALSSLSSSNRQGRVHVTQIADACQPRPFHEAVYVDGSEEFYLLVKAVSRPDLIPNVYMEAYTAVLHGRPYLNHDKVSDFTKGVDPTFSEIRLLLAGIDALCETELAAAFSRLEDQVQPFPLLQLPAELRLQVYSYLLPRESHIALLQQPHRDHRPPRLRLDIMRANKQLHDEVAKYLYENRTLFMVAARNSQSQTLSDEYMLRYYETLASMPTQTRLRFKKLEIQIGHLVSQPSAPRRYTDVPSVSDPMRHILALLPNLDTVVISFQSLLYTSVSTHRIVRERAETAEWLMKYIPASVSILWDLARAFAFPSKSEEQPMWQTIQARGVIKMGHSVFTQLECVRSSYSEQKQFKLLGLFRRSD
ncbi:Nn.00g004830.m01.CDS01 [Neocucurbitaria sp. VM-36]